MTKLENKKPFADSLKGVNLTAVIDITGDCKITLARRRRVVLIYGKYKKSNIVQISLTNTKYRMVHNVYYHARDIKKQIGNPDSTFQTFAGICNLSDQELYDLIKKGRPHQ